MSEGAKIALIVGGVLGGLMILAALLFLVLPLLFGLFVVHQLDTAFGESETMEISQSEGFTWNESTYQAGWRLEPDIGGRVRPTGLTLTTSGDAVRSLPEVYAIGFARDGVIVDYAECQTTDPIRPGTRNRLDCESTTRAIGAYDQIVIGWSEDIVIGQPWDLDDESD